MIEAPKDVGHMFATCLSLNSQNYVRFEFCFQHIFGYIIFRATNSFRECAIALLKSTTELLSLWCASFPCEHLYRAIWSASILINKICFGRLHDFRKCLFEMCIYLTFDAESVVERWRVSLFVRSLQNHIDKYNLIFFSFFQLFHSSFRLWQSFHLLLFFAHRTSLRSKRNAYSRISYLLCATRNVKSFNLNWNYKFMLLWRGFGNAPCDAPMQTCALSLLNIFFLICFFHCLHPHSFFIRCVAPSLAYEWQ